MAGLVRWEPFRDVIGFRDTVDRLFYGAGVWPGSRGRQSGIETLRNIEGVFPVDVYQTDEDVVVKASLPGVKAEDVEVSVTGRTLVIKAEASNQESEDAPDYYRQERRSGSFRRALTLPVKVDTDKAVASVENGVLLLTLPKAAEVRSTTIKVKATPAS